MINTKNQIYSKVFFYSLVAFLINLGAGHSFGYEWSKIFKGGEYGFSVQQTADGGFIIAGRTDSSGAGGYNVYLVKTDSNGSEQWIKTFGGSDYESGHSVQQTADGGFIIAGETSSFGAGLEDVYLIKTDSNGSEQWSKTFGGGGVDTGYSVQQTADGGFIIAGWTYSFGAGGDDVYLVKTDSNGSEQWSKTFGGETNDRGYSVQQTADGGFIIAGWTASFGAERDDVYLVKTDSNGSEQWSKTLGGSDYESGHSVQQTADGGFIIAGEAWPLGAGSFDVYLVKTDSNGSEQWSKTFGGSSIDIGRSVQQTSDSGFIIAGWTGSFGAGWVDVYLVKTDSNGSEQWSKTFGGEGDDTGYSVQQTADGGFIIAGHTDSLGAGGDDVYLVYYRPDWQKLLFTSVTPCRIVDTRKTLAGIIDANTQRDFRVYGPVSAQGGNAAGCPSPTGEPLAAHLNMVAVNPTGKGNLQAFPVGTGTGAGLSVNYNAIDTNLANAGSVKTVTGSGADITVASNFSSAHTVIDVLGYYYPDEGFYYTPVDPCRIVDSRKTSAGIIDANTQRDFRVFGPVSVQGGNSSGCPSTLSVPPEAAHINMIAVTPNGKGNLQGFPVGAGKGAGLSVNYNTIDTNLANAGNVKTVTGSGPDITVASNFSSAHTVIDVLGYYSEEEDLLYTPVKPCRIVDTRKTGAGIIDANTQRNFRVFGSVGSQGGNSGGCSSPGGQPRAAHINMIAVDPTGKGNLQAFPVGAGAGAGLSVNYNTIDTNLANAGTVKTITGTGPDITVRSNFSSAHTVIDVLGYYYPAP